jgi:predicted pyridoxine 5'-phosphate oxidase superfamily flavin-nucleotide-binding protein
MSRTFVEVGMAPPARPVRAGAGADRFPEKELGQDGFERFTEQEAAFISSRDSFYLGTVSENGWPYVQHRGGSPGFLKLVDDRTLVFGDYRGNRQYISTRNLAGNPRACLFLMDYPRRLRLKIYAEVETLAPGDEPDVTALVSNPNAFPIVERIFRLRLNAFDWNCKQHITPRFTERDIADTVRSLRERLAHLESENAELTRALSHGDLHNG